MTTHRISANPHQLSRLRSGERIVLVERVEQPLNPDVRITGSGQTDHDWVWYGADGYFEFRRKPCRPGDVLWFYIADQTEGYVAVIRGEETSWTRTVSTTIATIIGWSFEVVLIYRVAGTYKTQAIEHGAARYHPTTGEFEWIDRESGGVDAVQ